VRFTTSPGRAPPVLIFAGASPVHPGRRASPAAATSSSTGCKTFAISAASSAATSSTTTRNPHRQEPRSDRLSAHSQIAQSDPTGPVYLVAPREVLEETVPPAARRRPPTTQALAPPALAADDVRLLSPTRSAARAARWSSTSYLGRQPAPRPPRSSPGCAAGSASASLESVPGHVNYPHRRSALPGQPVERPAPQPDPRRPPICCSSSTATSPGSRWSTRRPRPDAAIYHIDVDPLKPPHCRCGRSPRGARGAPDAATRARPARRPPRPPARPARPAAVRRRAHRATTPRSHDQRRRALSAREHPDGDANHPPEYLTACVRRRLGRPQPSCSTEGISSYQTIGDHLLLTRPGSMADQAAAARWAGTAAPRSASSSRAPITP